MVFPTTGVVSNTPIRAYNPGDFNDTSMYSKPSNQELPILCRPGFIPVHDLQLVRLVAAAVVVVAVTVADDAKSRLAFCHDYDSGFELCFTQLPRFAWER